MEITKSLVFFYLLFINVNYAFSAFSIEAAQEVTQEASQDISINTAQKSIAVKNDEKPSVNGMIDYYHSDNVTNEIPYFDNRFRIDAELKEITLIFFRTRGSKPVILVQPDGKKMRINDYDREKIQWHDDRTFDMIKISKPMPGPWQAIGNILPESKILVVSDVKIEVDPLPDDLLSGETLKITGKLYNGPDRIDIQAFKDVVQLDVNFFSTNNSAYENFGVNAFKLTSFYDDGNDLDEYADDNIFTGEFVLDFALGEWQPVFVIKLPLITRELRQKIIMLHKSPVSLSVTTSETENMPHRLLLTIDPTYVDPSSLVFQGKITYPDKQTRPFSIMDNQNSDNLESRTKDIPYTEPGIHRINLSAFGRTKKGREFRLVVSEFSFNVKGDLNQALLATLDIHGDEKPATVETAEQALLKQKANIAEELALQQTKEEEEKTQTILIIAVANGILILFASIIFLIMRKRKVKNNKQ